MQSLLDSCFSVAINVKGCFKHLYINDLSVCVGMGKQLWFCFLELAADFGQEHVSTLYTAYLAYIL